MASENSARSGWLLSILLIAISLLALVLEMASTNCRVSTHASYWACAADWRNWGHIGPTLTDFLARLCEFVLAGTFVSAQVTTTKALAPLRIANWVSAFGSKEKQSARPIGSDDYLKILKMLDRYRREGNLSPEQIDRIAKAAIDLSQSDDEKDRAAFAAIAAEKPGGAAAQIAKRFPDDMSRQRQAAALFVPDDAMRAEKANQRILEIDQDDAEARIDMGLLKMQQGDRARAANDRDLAERSYKEARNCLDECPADKRNPAWRQIMARVHMGLGHGELARGRFDSAADHARKARDISAAFAAESPSAAEPQRALIQSHRLLGDIASAAGEAGHARNHYESAKNAANELSRQRPTVPEGRNIAVSFYDRLADLARYEGKLMAAVQHAERALDIAAGTHDPDVTDRDAKIARVDRLNAVAMVAIAGGDLGVADKHLRGAIALIDEMRRAEPRNLVWLERRSTTLARQGDIAAITGSPSEASNLFRQAIEAVEELLRAAPDHFLWRWERFALRVRLAKLASAQGNKDEAAVQQQLADELITEMARQWNLHPIVLRTFSDFRIAQPQPQFRMDIY